jgi:4-hydroxyphenylpyruvate dioxygenase
VIESGALDRPGDGLRMVLNGSQSNQTLSSRFVYEFFGSGVQHIALATDDIRATVARLVANGIEMLRMPENYYDDLASRGDLSEKDIADLTALNILYDTDAKGAYFQAYTATMEGGFFFEIVQRDSGYRGYGAPNAAVRLNAQSYAATWHAGSI